MNIDSILEAYQQGAGRWKGCDWETEFGPRCLNLKGISPSQARVVANATSNDESQCWHEAAAWLAHVERSAKRAETFAQAARDLAVSGQLLQALTYIRRACDIEQEFHEVPHWKGLCEAIEKDIDEVGPIADVPAVEARINGPVVMAWTCCSTPAPKRQYGVTQRPN